ncbi:MAG: hypothetical protein Pars2KO_14300 [Parasphingorhabdus sp.]
MKFTRFGPIPNHIGEKISFVRQIEIDPMAFRNLIFREIYEWWKGITILGESCTNVVIQIVSV